MAMHILQPFITALKEKQNQIFQTDMSGSTNSIDVVYLLGKESRWMDTEIKYSVRSVEKHLKNYRNIYIIGQKPLFFNDQIIEIPYQDIYGNKARNIMAKILRAASDARISKHFMLFNDDYFLLKDADAATYPYYYKNTLAQAIERNTGNYEYTQHINATIMALSEHPAYDQKNFDSHFPILYNKAKVKKVIDKYYWNIPFGYIFKSLYCNTLGIPGVLKEDCKINHPHIFENWPRITAGWDMLSIGDRCVNKSMEQYLFSLYPKKSKYEL